MADNWIQTFTGKAIDILDPKPEQYCIEDIAHALACKNRFAGMTREPYSVAQHCVLGARTLEAAGGSLALAFLLHELDEVALQDEHPYLKARMSIDVGANWDWLSYRDLAASHAEVALEGLGLEGLPFPPEVGAVDLRMLATEKRDLLGPSPKPWRIDLDGVLAFKETITPWPWYQAERSFLRAFARYFGACRAVRAL